MLSYASDECLLSMEVTLKWKSRQTFSFQYVRCSSTSLNTVFWWWLGLWNMNYVAKSNHFYPSQGVVILPLPVYWTWHPSGPQLRYWPITGQLVNVARLNRLIGWIQDFFFWRELFISRRLLFWSPMRYWTAWISIFGGKKREELGCFNTLLIVMATSFI